MRTLVMWSVEGAEIQKMLDKLGDNKETRKALKDALNDTAKQARKRLFGKAEKTYTIKDVDFDKEMLLRKATPGNLKAVIHSDGEPIRLTRFKTDFSGEGLRAQIIKSGSLKLIRKGRVNAFVNKISKKGQKRKKDTKKGKKGTDVMHFDAAQREGKGRLGIKSLFSNSIPVMIGNEKRVYGVVEPFIESDLQTSIEKHIAQVLGG